ARRRARGRHHDDVAHGGRCRRARRRSELRHVFGSDHVGALMSGVLAVAEPGSVIAACCGAEQRTRTEKDYEPLLHPSFLFSLGAHVRLVLHRSNTTDDTLGWTHAKPGARRRRGPATRDTNDPLEDHLRRITAEDG